MSDRPPSPPTARVIEVLSVVASSETALGLTEIARASGCSTSTCAQVLAELIAARWIERDADKRHHLGTGLLPLAAAVSAKYPSDAAVRVLTTLHDEFGCEASLSRYDETTMTKVASVGGAGPAKIGPNLPLTPPLGIEGQALLPDEEFEAWLDEANPALTNQRRKLLQSIAAFVRKRGWGAWQLAEAPDPMLDALRAAMPASLSEAERESALSQVARVNTVASAGFISDKDLKAGGRLGVAYVIAPVDSQPRYQIELHVLDPAVSTKQVLRIGERLSESAAELAAAT